MNKKNKKTNKNTVLCISVTNIIYIYIYIFFNYYSIFGILIKSNLKKQKDKFNIKIRHWNSTKSQKIGLPRDILDFDLKRPLMTSFAKCI